MLRLIENQGMTEALHELGTLDEIAREGARRMLLIALETENAAYIGHHQTPAIGVAFILVVPDVGRKERLRKGRL